MPAIPLARRVIARLAHAEDCELNPHYRDDLRIARLTVAFAASGEARLCSPDVLASYTVLGLHPSKVWPAICARREALGGPLRTAGAPPKKPAQSVKLWCEKTNGARAANSRAGGTLLRDNTISVPMAAPSIAAAYRKPEGSESVFFKLEELQEFFDTCPPDLVETRQLRTIESMWNAVGKALGKKPFGARIQFFLSINHYRTNRYRSESAVRYNIRRAERDGNLQVDYRDDLGRCHHIWVRPRTNSDRGDYRRVPTYSLSVPLLLRWREWKRTGKLHADALPIRKPAQPTPTDPPPAHAAPKPEEPRRAAAEHRSPAPAKPAQPKLTRRECVKFMANFEQRKRGRTSYFSRADGLNVALHPGEEGYSPPMEAGAAFLAECEAWGREKDAVLYALKFWAYTIPAGLTL